MHYALSPTNPLAEHRSPPDLMHFQKYALLPYALLHFLLYTEGLRTRPAVTCEHGPRAHYISTPASYRLSENSVFIAGGGY